MTDEILIAGLKRKYAELAGQHRVALKTAHALKDDIATIKATLKLFSAEGALIAQMAVVGTMELREAIAQKILVGEGIPFHHAKLTDRVVIFRSLATHPEWGGNDLAKTLVSVASTLPLAQSAAHIFAQVSSANKRSWSIFTKQAFGIVSAVYAPQDEQPCFILQKPAFDFDFSPEVIVDEVCSCEDFAAIVTLTQREALVGVCDKACPDKLAFLRNEEVSDLMPVLARVNARG